MGTTGPYDIGLDKNPANYQPLTPLTYLERAAATFPDHTAIIHGNHAGTLSRFLSPGRSGSALRWQNAASARAIRCR
jgi:fatty-acyl-CoA synthase